MFNPLVLNLCIIFVLQAKGLISFDPEWIISICLISAFLILIEALGDSIKNFAHKKSIAIRAFLIYNYADCNERMSFLYNTMLNFYWFFNKTYFFTFSIICNLNLFTKFANKLENIYLYTIVSENLANIEIFKYNLIKNFENVRSLKTKNSVFSKIKILKNSKLNFGSNSIWLRSAFNLLAK